MKSEIIVLKKADSEDCRFFLELANAPDVRAVSFSGESIPWETHCKWFEDKLADSDSFLFTAADKVSGKKLGYIRFEKKHDFFIISLCLAEEFRGKGLGTILIEHGTSELFRDCPEAEKILAYIRPDNHASIRAFKNAGYKNAGFATINEDNDAVLMVKKRNADSTVQDI